MAFHQYLEESKRAVVQLFDALSYYHEIRKGAVLASPIIDRTDEEKAQCERQTYRKNNKASIEKALNKQREYLGNFVSESTICGAILQIAFMGIQSFSKNESIPDESAKIFASIKSENLKKKAKFFIGKRVCRLPIGLIIYAGRNQYNHMDENELKDPINLEVFKQISRCTPDGDYYQGFTDPAFELSNPKKLQIYSSNILALLEWQEYENYRADMQNMIPE